MTSIMCRTHHLACRRGALCAAACALAVALLAGCAGPPSRTGDDPSARDDPMRVEGGATMGGRATTTRGGYTPPYSSW
jgi:hypothetical protein